MHRVIIIEDEQDIAELIQIHLEEMECHTLHFRDGLKGYQYALENNFDTLILDVNLPSMSGIDICKQLRASSIKSPILMLTARSEEADKILGLEIGADDYLTKPFSVRELAARVKALLRRVQIDTTQDRDLRSIHVKDLEINPKIRKVTLRGTRIELTPKEFELLYLLASNPGVTYDRSDLLNQVWGYDFEGYEHTVNSHINRLRAKVERDPAKPDYVLTTWGVGYRFTDV
jgi:two-component system alkaline phosphatase synthesis response regulator PhoP